MNRYPACSAKIGRNLAYRRGLLRLSQDQVAAALKLQRSAVSAIEHGRRQLSLPEAIILQEHLAILVDHLTDGTPIAY